MSVFSSISKQAVAERAIDRASIIANIRFVVFIAILLIKII